MSAEQQRSHAEDAVVAFVQDTLRASGVRSADERARLGREIAVEALDLATTRCAEIRRHLKPAQFFVRVYTPDPAEQDADSEEDTDAPSKAAALSRAERLRMAGKRACAFERRNIRYPEGVPPGLNLPYDFESVSLEPDHGAQ